MSGRGKIKYRPGGRSRWTGQSYGRKARGVPRRLDFRSGQRGWLRGPMPTILALLIALTIGWLLPSSSKIADIALNSFRSVMVEPTAAQPRVVRPSGDAHDDGARILRAKGTGSTESTAIFVGRASVVDGDTLEIQGQRIRLNGIDAPESDQRCKDGRGKSYRCGAEAAAELSKILAASRPTSCEFVDNDAYGRMVADCYRADGENVAALLVNTGHALDWPRYSNGRYAADQADARASKRGLWRGAFTEPWAWRESQRQQQQAESANAPARLLQSNSRSSECNIKGNISSKGERIYHVPGQRYYDRTKISPSKGERWFCTEGEVRAAGWRRSKV